VPYLAFLVKPLTLSCDSGYFDFGEILAMTLMLLIVLAPAQFENAHLVMAPLGKDFRLHGRSADERPAHLEVFAVGDKQHLVEDDFSADFRRQLFYFQFFAGSDTVLLAAGFYDRVHVETPKRRNSNKTKEPKMIQQFSFGRQKLYAMISSLPNPFSSPGFLPFAPCP
jgi:hypothetical protein